MTSSSSSTRTTTEEWVLDMLACFRFHPSEEDMVNLLRKKMDGKGSQVSPEIDCEDWDSPGNGYISLFVRFLKKMMQGKHSEACQIIPDLDVGYDPWDLPELMFPDNPYEAREWYSFSRPDYKYINSPRCNRATKQGFWKITGKPLVIKELSKSVTCKKRTLTFYEGRVSNSKKTSWVKHEYYFTKTEPGSNPNQPTDFVFWRLKNKSDNKKKLKDTSTCSELVDPGTGGYLVSNSEDHQAAADHMIPVADEYLAYKELEHTLLGSGNDEDTSTFNELADPATGGYLVSNSEDPQAAANHMISEADEYLAYKELEHFLLGSGNGDDDEPGGCFLSDFDDQELFAQKGESLGSPVPPPKPPQPHQSPQLGNVPDVYDDEGSNWPSPIGDDNSYFTSKSISTNYDDESVGNVAYKIQSRATDDSISEVENDPLQSPMWYSELGDLPHANNYIGCNELQSLDMEIVTLFP